MVLVFLFVRVCISFGYDPLVLRVPELLIICQLCYLLNWLHGFNFYYYFVYAITFLSFA